MKTIFTDDQIHDRLVGKYDELFENCVIKERPRERADYEWPDTNEETAILLIQNIRRHAEIIWICWKNTASKQCSRI